MVEDNKHSITRRSALASTVAAGNLLIAGCLGADGGDTSPTSADPDQIELGLLMDFDGPFAFGFENLVAAMELAREEIHSAGLLNGTEIKFSKQDMDLNPQGAISGYETLKSQEVFALVGLSSTTAVPLIDRIKNDEMPAFLPTSGTITLDGVGGEYIYRTGPGDTIVARATGVWAAKQGWKDMAAVFVNETGPLSFTRAVGDGFKANGGENVEEYRVESGASSYRSTLQQVADQDPDVVMTGMRVDDMTTFVRNYRQVGVGATILVGSDVVTNEEIIDELGSDTNGLTGGTAFQVQQQEEFASKYEDFTGEEVGLLADRGYDVMNLIALAIESAGEVSQSSLLANVKPVANSPGTEVTNFPEGKDELTDGNDINYDGVSNPMDLDDNGDVTSSPVGIFQIQDEEWVPVTTIEAEEIQP